MSRPPLCTYDEVVFALGGVAALSRLLGVSMPAVSQWRSRLVERFPAWTFPVMEAALAKLGETAERDLWAFEKPANRAAAPRIGAEND